MPESYNLTTKEKVKAMLDISGSTDDTFLDALCDDVTAFIEKLCGGQRFKATEHEYEIHDGDKPLIKLQHRFIYEDVDVEVEYNNGTNESPDWVLLTANDYDLYLDNGVIILGAPIYGRRNIRVTYTAGFATIPHDVEMTATNMVARAYNRRKSQGLSSESFEGVNMNWNDTMTEQEKATVGHYTNYSFI